MDFGTSYSHIIFVLVWSISKSDFERVINVQRVTSSKGFAKGFSRLRNPVLPIYSGLDKASRTKT